MESILASLNWKKSCSKVSHHLPSIILSRCWMVEYKYCTQSLSSDLHQSMIGRHRYPKVRPVIRIFGLLIPIPTVLKASMWITCKWSCTSINKKCKKKYLYLLNLRFHWTLKRSTCMNVTYSKVISVAIRSIFYGKNIFFTVWCRSL